MSTHWTDDGGLIEVSDSHSSDMAAFAGQDKMAVLKEVGILAGGVWGASFLLSAISSYRSTRDSSKGMPSYDLGIAEPGLDWVVAGGGLLLGILAGNWLGPFWQTASIGIGLGGLAVTGVHWGAVVGHEAAKTSGVGAFFDSAVSSVKGLFTVGAHHHDRAANMSAEAQSLLAEYEGA